MGDIQQWVCEKRGVCKARMHSRNSLLIKPSLPNEVHASNTHGSDPSRIEMLKGYNYVKERSKDSEESARAILSIGIEQMTSPSREKLPNLE